MGTHSTHIKDAVKFAQAVCHSLLAHSQVCKALCAYGDVWEQLYDDTSSWLALDLDVQVYLQAATRCLRTDAAGCAGGATFGR